MPVLSTHTFKQKGWQMQSNLVRGLINLPPPHPYRLSGSPMLLYTSIRISCTMCTTKISSYQHLRLEIDSIITWVTCRLMPESSILFSDILPMDRFWLLSSNVSLRDVLDWALKNGNIIYTQYLKKDLFKKKKKIGFPSRVTWEDYLNQSLLKTTTTTTKTYERRKF